MKPNMGKIDKIIRVMTAIVIAALYITGMLSGKLGLTLLMLGGVFLLTSIFSFCPLYLPFGISTCKKSNK